jgi:hypothetical protein
MPEVASRTRQALSEALELSAEILGDLELSRMPLANITLKALRLARLLNDASYIKIMSFEVAGYPGTPTGVPPEVWEAAVAAGRFFQEKDPQTGQVGDYVYLNSVESLEQQINIAGPALAAARDPNRPAKGPFDPMNAPERSRIRQDASTASGRLAARRTPIYHYALRKHYELKFSGIADDVFTRVRARVDSMIGATVPDAIQKFSAVHENLLSENPEDWANAVHSCRRILQDLADKLFPPTEETRSINKDGRTIVVRLGKDHYINRLLAFAEDASESARFTDIVGSHLMFLGERLDSVFSAAQKGSHASVAKEEADRYVIYTYLIVGDLLTLAGRARAKGAARVL